MTALSVTPKRAWMERPTLRVGIVATLVFLLLGFVSIVWTPYPVDSLNVGGAMQDPSLAHWFGTDQLGRDMLSLTMKAVLTSFIVSAIAVAIGALVGLPLGFAAAAWGGPVNWLILRLTDFLFAFPALILAILITTSFGPSTLNVMLAVGIFNIPAFARVARAGALSFKSRDYVAAARLSGMGGIEIARRHILPDVTRLLLAQAITLLATGILAEAGLSYVGLGAQPPTTSLGLILRDAQTYAMSKPTLALLPGVTLVLIIVALNLAADGVRDTLASPLRRLGAADDAA